MGFIILVSKLIISIIMLCMLKKKIIFYLIIIFSLQVASCLFYYGANYIIFSKIKDNPDLLLPQISVLDDSNQNEINITPHFAWQGAYLTMDKISIGDHALLGNIKINFSLLSTLTLSPQINKAFIKQVNINLDNFDTSTLNDKIFDFIANLDIPKIDYLIKNLLIENSSTKETMIINQVNVSNNSDAINFQGILNKGTIKGNYAHQDKTLTLHYNDKDITFKLNQYFNSKENSSFSLEVNNISNIIKNHLSQYDNLLSKNTNNLVINGQFVTNDNFLSLHDISINSNFIKGAGKAIISLSSKYRSDLKLNLNTLDITKLFNNVKIPFSNIRNSLKFFGDLIDNAEFGLDLHTEKFITHNYTLDNIILNGDINNQIFNIYKFQAMHDQEIIKFTGDFHSNKFKSSIEGQVNLAYSDVNKLLDAIALEDYKTPNDKKYPLFINAHLVLSSREMMLSDMNSRLGSGTIRGDFGWKLIGDNPRIHANLQTERMKYNENTPIIHKAVNYLESLIKETKSGNYIDRFNSLRNMGYTGLLSINSRNGSLYNVDFDDLNLLINLSDNFIDFSNFEFMEGKNFINGRSWIFLDGLTPNVTLNIKNAALIDFPSLTFSHLQQAHSYLKENYDFSKINFNTNINISDLNGLLGMPVKKLTLALESDNKIIKIPNLTYELFDGVFESNGSMSIEPFSINIGYAMNDFLWDDINNYYFNKYFPFSGRFSIGGQISTIGNSLEEWLYNLKSKSNFVSNNVKLKGINVDGLIDKLREDNYNIGNLDQDIKEFTDTGDTDINGFKGFIEMNRGIINFGDIMYNTEKSSASAAGAINIYDSSIIFDSLYSFIIPKQMRYGQINDSSVNLGINFSGALFDSQKSLNYDSIKLFFEPSE